MSVPFILFSASFFLHDATIFHFLMLKYDCPSSLHIFTFLTFSSSSITFLLHCCYYPSYSAYKWIYEKLRGNVPLQYLVWVIYPMMLILFASFFCNLVAPQAIGMYSLLFPEPLTSVHPQLSCRSFILSTSAALSTF